MKLSLYLNLSQCYIKLENWEQVLRNCNEALALEPENPKALFRRSTVHEQKKDWDKVKSVFTYKHAYIHTYIIYIYKYII